MKKKFIKPDLFVDKHGIIWQLDKINDSTGEIFLSNHEIEQAKFTVKEGLLASEVFVNNFEELK